MCVPAVEELEYLGWYENPPPAPKCLIHHQLDLMHHGLRNNVTNEGVTGALEDHGLPTVANKHRGAVNVWGEEFGNLSSMHGYDQWWIQEEDLPLKEDEEIKDWKPPDWGDGQKATEAVGVSSVSRALKGVLKWFVGNTGNAHRSQNGKVF